MWDEPPCKPLADGCDASLRVRCRLDHPVWGESNAALQAGSAMLGSLARLEMICRRMVVVVSTNPDGDKAKIKKLRQRAEECHIEVAEAFDELYCPDESIVSYMDRSGLSRMFPKTRAILNDPPRPLPKARVAMDTYFQHFAMLNQLVSLAQQLRFDLPREASHKYIAHQIAMLYQCLTNAGEPVSQYRKAVEGKFTEIKEATRAKDNNVPALPLHLAAWLDKLLGNIIKTVGRMPMLYRDPMVAVAGFLKFQASEF